MTTVSTSLYSSLQRETQAVVRAHFSTTWTTKGYKIHILSESRKEHLSFIETNNLFFATVEGLLFYIRTRIDAFAQKNPIVGDQTKTPSLTVDLFIKNSLNKFLWFRVTANREGTSAIWTLPLLKSQMVKYYDLINRGTAACKLTLFDSKENFIIP